MRDINKPEGDNLGGIILFSFIDVNDVQSIDDTVDGSIDSAVILKTEKQWYCGYGTQQSIGYSEPQSETLAGAIYNRQFIANCPQDGADNNQLFDEMRHKRFIIDYKDSNGLRKLVGTLEEPLKFSATLNTKTNITELAGHTIMFYGEATKKAPIYNL